MVGAIDGRNLVIQAPAKSGTLYRNYKGTFGIIFLFICDAKYNFTLLDISQYGSKYDIGVLAQLKMSIVFKNNTLNFSESEVLPATNLDIMYFLVGDGIFMLKLWLLSLYPGRLPQLLEMICNYHHSRSRRVIENVFRILRTCWRIFSHPIKASV